MTKQKYIELILFMIATLCMGQCTSAYASVNIAFIDSGISTKHISKESVLQGKNYVFPLQNTEDRVGHGTAVAGAVLGSEELAVKGTCPDAKAVPLVVYDLYPSGVVESGGIEALCDAIYDAVDVYDCRVINISMGIPSEAECIKAAVLYAEQKNAVVVSAVGNDNLTFPDRIYYPAKYKSVIGVGAADGEYPADFSQRNGVSVLAPGKNLSSAGIHNATKAELRSGSSYACAVVSGLCAKLLIDNPTLTPAMVRTLLYTSASDIGQCGFDKDSGFGIVGAPLKNNSMTRATLIQLLYVTENAPEVTLDCAFTDVGENPYEEKAIAWAAQNGIVMGCGDTAFAPHRKITVEETVLILYRYGLYKKIAYPIPPLLDSKISGISDYAIPSVYWAQKIGLLDDIENITSPLTKEKAVAILQLLFQMTE